jgi:FkbM family methyltransferase
MKVRHLRDFLLPLWRLYRDPYFEPITAAIADQLPWWKQQIIVQIGTNDGERGDPVSTLLENRRLWHALLVEPLPEYFGRLVKRYGSSRRFMFDQAAIGTEVGTQPFYYIDERARASPQWRDYFDRIGSLSRSDVILNLGDCADTLSSYIVETEVNVLSIDAILRKWDIDKIDALIVDAEGYDWEIIKRTLDIGLRPKVIVFEYTHLNPAARADALSALERYSIKQFAQDYVCVLTSSPLA